MRIKFLPFNPIGKEDLKWSMVTLKPRYSEHMESGALYFVAQGNTHGKRYGIENGVESKPLTIITRATKNIHRIRYLY